MWDALGTGEAISEDDWQQFLMASMVFYVNLSASRLPLDAGVAERERYQTAVGHRADDGVLARLAADATGRGGHDLCGRRRISRRLRG